MNDETLWQAKMAARLHDPVEKALILMRTVEGHERGTSEALRRQLGLAELPPEIVEAVERADHWASAADRAAFPRRNTDGRYPAWQNVRFHEQPVIIHPLTGVAFDLGKLSEVEPDQVKALALDHFQKLVHEGDLRRTALAFWRFGPEIAATEIKSLWAMLPADTRVPDHTIFDHLDLVTALAGSFALDAEGPALLAVSLGPVQDFIAAARTTSDLWAGSHLLSRMSWEAMRVVCEELGPEAIIFPRLRAVPQVDLWLRDECGLRPPLFEDCAWNRQRTDANPLFAAALPNRFTALVPAGRARQIAEEITTHVRDWVRERAEDAYRLLLKEADVGDSPELPGYGQIREQLDGFPEVHWAAVPWSLIETDGSGKVDTAGIRLAEAMRPFFASDPPGHLGSRAWQLLAGGVQLEAGWFWKPNPGALYPALHELMERVLAAAKSVRPFAQARQEGWRDSLSGEAEWLTTDREQLALPPGQRSDTLWSRVAAGRPTWTRKGEHLSALNGLKRLWPTLFVRELGETLDAGISRFVVSTHTMALATSLARVISDGRHLPQELADAIRDADPERVALPRKLATGMASHPDGDTLRRLPGWLDAVDDAGSESEERRSKRLVADYLGHKPEAYYGLLLMDGDRMGAWLSADREMTFAHKHSFHPHIRAGLQSMGDDSNMAAYVEELRAPSPSRHMAISDALNNFALRLAPAVVEERHHGRILYAGGDDLMAMLPVIDLLSAMIELRAAYSGVDPKDIGSQGPDAGFERQANGFVKHRGELLRVMGEKATASCGAVVAHHQAPLGAVLRELRSAEQRAKKEGGRDAFSLCIVKRSGGALRLTAKWGDPPRLLMKLREFLAEPEVSRRAVYNSATWLKDLPEPEGEGEIVAQMLAYQLDRQAGRKTNRDHYDLPGLARALVAQAVSHARPDRRLAWLENFLSTAEFLARETRGPESSTSVRAKEAAA